MNGIIILALNKQSYACAAFNLALSIKKYNPTLNITLLTDNTHQMCFRPEHYAVFDWIKEVDKEDYTGLNGFCPAKAKLAMYKYSTYKQTLYVDADSLCFQDLTALFSKLKGNAFKSNNVNDYTQWTDDNHFKDFFGVEVGDTINSSWIYFENNKVFKQAQKFYAKGFDITKLKQKWGNSIPDELMLNGAIQNLAVNPKVDFPVMFFDDRKDTRDTTQLMEDFYFMTFYGNANSTRLQFREFYDRYLFKLCTEKGIEHRFKMSGIISQKHVLTK